MNALSVIIDIILILVSIVLIIAVLLQQGQRQGLGAIAGGAETFFGKNKAKSYEAKMAKITKIGAAIFIVAAIAATMSPIFISIALISFSFLFARAGFSIMVLHDFRFCPAVIEKTPAAC
mgnify:CR=1 FL=1